MSQFASETIYRASRTEQLSEAVTRAVAESEGVDPTALDTPLYEAIDPDALDDLVRLRRTAEVPSPVRVQFSYYGYEINVHGDGKLLLRRE